MGEAEKERQRNLDQARGDVDSLDERRTYEAPEVTVLEFATVIKGGSGPLTDGAGHPRG